MSVEKVVRFKTAIEKAAAGMREAADTLDEIVRDHDGPGKKEGAIGVDMLRKITDVIEEMLAATDKLVSSRETSR